MNILLCIAFLAYSPITIPCCTLDESQERWRWGEHEHQRAQEMENESRAHLVDGMWGSKNYRLPIDEKELMRGTFESESVGTPFFVQLADKSEEEKVAILKIAVQHPCRPAVGRKCDESYFERRANIAALVLIAKINLKALGEHHHINLLHQATDHGDFPLAQLLLDNGASVHECDGDCNSMNTRTPIFYAETERFALMLIERGALQGDYTRTLLHYTMSDTGYNQAKLAKLYIQHGADIFATNQQGNTALFSLVSFAINHSEAIGKAKILLEPLPSAQKVDLINKINHNKLTVFDHITWCKKNFTWQSSLQRLNELQQFLEHVREHPEEKL